jgi:pimeloyl-ACP methyl ester carboxylesterase
MTGLTRTRIAALVLIGLAVLSLGYLRSAQGDDPVSVPRGALAGDLLMHPCTYDTEDGSFAADCGTLVVPENRADPGSRLIAIPVTRIRARSAHPKEPVFRLQGGPGKTNMSFSMGSRFAAERDVVLVGYRGVDGSVRLDCPEVEAALKRSTDFLSEASMQAYGDGFRACAQRLTDDGVDLAGYSLPQRVDDFEAARAALGYGRIDLLSESAGTRTAMIYAWRYPDSIHRSVMIGVNPPGHFVWDAKTTNEQLARYSEACAVDSSCSGRTDDLSASIRQTAADLPDRWFFLPVDEGTLRVGSFYSFAETTQENAPLSAPMELDSWLAAADGDVSGFWFTSFFADLSFPGAFVWGEYAATARADAEAANEYFSGGEAPDTNLGYSATAFGWGGGRLTEAWPAEPDEAEYSQVRPSNVETLLIGGKLDLATPPQWATSELLPELPTGDQIVLPGFGHSTSFWFDQKDAGTHLINTYFDSGRADDSLYVDRPVDFTPEVTQAALGKGIAGTMVGLAALTILSLLWMAVRRKPRFGRMTGPIMRSLYPVVLGLGGWFAGVLVVVTTMPGTPLDDQRLATLSVGLPVGLGIYWAWRNREWMAATKLAGFVAAIGGALLGAWLGFHAGADLLALVTAILGAIAGGNLTLVLLDVVWDRKARDRFAYAESGGAGGITGEVSVGRSSGR